MSLAADKIPNRFDFESAQERLYKLWNDGGYFRGTPDPEKQPFSIVIPPPNVTGALHLGHALNNTLQDILARMKRMQGYSVLWMPGTDHAGIATQAVVERRLKEEENKTRHDLGRDELVQRIWRWKDQYEARILSQLQQMGCSCDWERTRFTLDETCARAVRHTFYDLFQKSLIYRGKRLVNWDTHLKTAVSDDEVFNQKIRGHFWHFRYPVIDPQAGEPTHITIATTRPETMLGDTAVAVHPDPATAFDKVASELQAKLKSCKDSERADIESQIQALQDRREQMLPALEQLRDMALDGRKLMLPLMEREIPLIADEWAKPELGSGCVKITPAHDPNDYEVGKRHDLTMLNVMNADGTMNAETGPYEGLHLKKARAKVVADLEALDLVSEIEEREIDLPCSDRSKEPIEPLLADQWFVRMDTLAQTAMDAVEGGQIKITPERYVRGYLDWLSEKRDWPVSRQLWWGHQIPVWSKDIADENELQALEKELSDGLNINGTTASFQIEACEETNEEKRIRLGLPFATAHICILNEDDPLEKLVEDAGFVREEDVLDTWFSSALWPHSTLGWPEKTEELDYYYPTSTLITSRDIITLWVARMVLMGQNNVGDIPFHEVYIHPKILDGFGETMSKSKGNGIDPLDVIEKFGADALRFGMARLTTETQDVKMPVKYECPHCEAAIDQTKKNRILPRIECKSCQKAFSTQWAESEEDRALKRGAVLSERFEQARNFGNKLWNAARFAMMHLDDYAPGTLDESDLRTEDRWLLSRLSTVTQNVTQALEGYRYADASRELYDFTWDEFCSFYLEMLKDRFSDSGQRATAQRMLVTAFDQILRLLHPMIPFLTEEIWRAFGDVAPSRGYPEVKEAEPVLIVAAWPEFHEDWQDPAIEQQFRLFQKALGAVREIRSSQNLAPKTQIEFKIKTDSETGDAVRPMVAYFRSMANSDCVEIASEIERPAFHAMSTLDGMEIVVDLTEHIDKDAERARLEKEVARTEGLIKGKKAKLSNEKFVSGAPEDIVQRERESLAKLEAQLVTLTESLAMLAVS